MMYIKIWTFWYSVDYKRVKPEQIVIIIYKAVSSVVDKLYQCQLLI